MLTNVRKLMLAGAFVATCVWAGPASRMGPAPGSGPPPNVLPPMLQGVGVDEHLGRDIDLNLTFTAENGYPVALKDYFNQGRPVILNLIYYSCPMLCNLILNGQTAVLREIPWTPGKEFEVVTISIDPREAFDLARKKKLVYLGSYDRPAPGWHFLTDRDGNAKRLAELIGFHYRYDESQEQYAHSAAIFILSPQGKISRYLYGVRYRARDLRFALAEAGANRVTTTVEKILLFCYHYDPKTGSYVLFATNIMRAGGIFTVLLISLFLWRMFRNERKKSALAIAGMPPRERLV
jgi:protein SCO1/2